MAIQGKRIDNSLKRLVQREFLILHKEGEKMSGQRVLDSLSDKFPDMHENEDLPSVTTINTYTKGLRAAIKEAGDEFIDSSWSLIKWKNSADKGGITPESVPLILEVQQMLLLGQLNQEEGHHWTSTKRITFREASWISQLHQVGAVDEHTFLDKQDCYSSVWRIAEEYAEVERLTYLLGLEDEPLINDLSILPLMSNPKNRYRLISELRFASDLSLTPPVTEKNANLLEELYAAPGQGVQDEMYVDEYADEDEIEFPEVTYGLKTTYFKLLNQGKVRAKFESDDKSEVIIGGVDKEQGTNYYPWIRNDYAILMEDMEDLLYSEDSTADSIPYFWDGFTVFLPPEFGSLNYPLFSKASVDMALNQIPPRDKEGNYKVETFNPDIVRKAENYLNRIALIMEKVIQIPTVQKRLDIELVNPDSDDYKEEEKFNLKNYREHGPFGPETFPHELLNR